MTHDMFAVWVIHNKDKHWPTPLDMSQHTGNPKYLLTMPPSSSLALRYVGVRTAAADYRVYGAQNVITVDRSVHSSKDNE